MLVLPNDQVLYKNNNYLSVYTAGETPQPSWRPRITTVATSLQPGGTYRVSGAQVGGLTQGSGDGDDYQSATNYPLVRITNGATGQVVYAPTSAMTAMSVASGAPSSADFTLPASTDTGPASLAVVANGIAPAPVPVTVGPAATGRAGSAARARQPTPELDGRVCTVEPTGGENVEAGGSSE